MKLVRVNNFKWKENIQMISKHGEVINFNILSCTLGYSRLHTFVYSETKTSEDLLRCMIETFKMIGGLPKTILTDNMPSIVRIENGKRYKYNKISEFEKDFGIQIKFCKVKTPQTKGKDESCNRFLNWLKPYNFKFENKEELLMIIANINKRVNQQINQTTKIPPIKLFQKEKEYLDPLPSDLLLDSYINKVMTQIVPPTLLVRFLGKEYSVSKQFINKRVKLFAIEDKLYIYHNTTLITIHTISDNNINYHPSHYKEALRSSINKNDDEIEKIAIENLKLLERIGNNDEQL